MSTDDELFLLGYMPGLAAVARRIDDDAATIIRLREGIDQIIDRMGIAVAGAEALGNVGKADLARSVKSDLEALL